MILELIFVLILVLVVVGAVNLHVGETRAKAEADRIINGEEPAAEQKINEIITTLLRAKNFMGHKTEQDRYRIKRLRDIRKEIVTPHDILDKISESSG